MLSGMWQQHRKGVCVCVYVAAKEEGGASSVEIPRRLGSPSMGQPRFLGWRFAVEALWLASKRSITSPERTAPFFLFLHTQTDNIRVCVYREKAAEERERQLVSWPIRIEARGRSISNCSRRQPTKAERLLRETVRYCWELKYESREAQKHLDTVLKSRSLQSGEVNRSTRARRLFLLSRPFSPSADRLKQSFQQQQQHSFWIFPIWTLYRPNFDLDRCAPVRTSARKNRCAL
jgi:hypothetical protein